MNKGWKFLLALAMILATSNFTSLFAEEIEKPAQERFSVDTKEVPDFRKHIIPLTGKLGCNSRACHGSFQGQGGFRLSLFGYDFAEDLKNMMEGDEPRINLKDLTVKEIPIVDQFFLGEHLAEVLRDHIKIAVVWHGIHNSRFFQSVATNRSALLRVFRSLKNAEVWLLHDKENEPFDDAPFVGGVELNPDGWCF